MPEAGLAWGPLIVGIILAICAVACAIGLVYSFLRKGWDFGARLFCGSLSALGVLVCGWMSFVYFVLAECMPWKSCP